MDEVNLDDYIFAQEQNREALTIRRFFADSLSFLGHWFSPTLKWDLPYVWLGLRIPHERLLRGFSRPPKRFLGDVDVFGACLETSSPNEYQEYLTKFKALFPPTAHPTQIISLTIQTMIAEGKAKWPPSLSYITAAEVKAAYYNAAGDLKAAGDRCNGRSQALELCRMGFDRVALARFVVTEPVPSGRHHPWMIASARSGRAMDEYTEESKGIFVRNDDPFGTILISSGAVLGKLEHMAGGTSGEWLREPPDNPSKQEASSVREAVDRSLQALFDQHKFPRTFPVLILACSDEKCGHLYISGANANAVCPNCGKPPR
ncbi:MAG TPA: hypothetical protein VJU86_01945 [Pyrinomonadaceae bacterium]|nr:hypothetical protein [Pyrinomonadaceae bacterium]